MNLPPQIQQLSARIDSMSLRERALIAASMIAVLFLLWDTALMRPLNALHEARAVQLESLQTQVADLNRAIQGAVSSDSADPEQAARRELAESRSRLVEMNRELSKVTRTLIEPAQMGRVLDQLLSGTEGLDLVSMRNLDPQALGNDMGDDKGGDTASGTDGAPYYRHGIEIEVRGPYHAVLKYLRAIERFEWQFVWGRVELQVDEHPHNRTRIVLYSLSLQEGLLGV